MPIPKNNSPLPASIAEAFTRRVGIPLLLFAVAFYASASARGDDLSTAEQAELVGELNSGPSSGSSLEQVNLQRSEQAFGLFVQASGGSAAPIVDDYTEQGISRLPAFRDGDTSGTALGTPNIIGRIDGEDPDSWIVVGAHLDKVAAGHGVIDDWSGCVVVTNLYQRLLKRGKPKHTFLFVCFAYEESGLWGSRTLVSRLRAAKQLDNVKAMVNWECLGVSGLHIWRNGSTPWLAEAAINVGRDVTMLDEEIVNRDLTGVGADSVPFFNEAIPSITLDSLSSADFPKIHTDLDNIQAITKDQLGLSGYKQYFDAFRLADDYLAALDTDPRLDPPSPRSQRRRFIPPLPIRSFHPGEHMPLAAFRTAAAGRNAKAARAAVADDGAHTIVVREGDEWIVLIVKEDRIYRIPLNQIQTTTGNSPNLQEFHSSSLQ